MRFLVVRLGAMGDVLRTVPAAEALRRAFPEARFAWAVDAPWAPLLECIPGFLPVRFPRGDFKRASSRWTGWPSAAGIAAAWRRSLRAEAPDVAVDFHGNLRSGVTARFSGAPVRIGFDGAEQKEGNRRFSTHRLPLERARRPRLERNTALARALIESAGLEWEGRPPSPLAFDWPDEARRTAERFADTGPYVAIAPAVSAAQAYKTPPIPLLVAAARRSRDAGRSVWIVWGPGERDQAERLARDCEGAAAVAPETSLVELGAVLAGASGFVGGDTGPMHLACAVGVPVLALYGPTDPRVNAPWSPRAFALSPPGREYTGVKRIDRREGFDGLTEAAVAEAAGRLLEA